VEIPTSQDAALNARLMKFSSNPPNRLSTHQSRRLDRKHIEIFDGKLPTIEA
jgi:hypothetical protein